MTAIHSPLTCDHCGASGVVLRETPTVADPYAILCSACWWQQMDDRSFHSFPLAQEIRKACDLCGETDPELRSIKFANGSSTPWCRECFGVREECDFTDFPLAQEATDAHRIR